MMFLGTIVNVVCVIAGALLGTWAGSFLSDRLRRTVMAGLGLAVLLIGLKLALGSQQLMVVIGSLILGGLAGEALKIEQRLTAFGERLQERFANLGKVGEAFVTSSLLYCVGAMAIMGALQDGTGNEPTILYAKSVLDGVASVALASTLGIGVIFSIVPLAIYQGGITWAAGLAQMVLTEAVVVEMNAVGGLLIAAIALDLLDIKRLPIANLLPGVFVCIGLMWGFGLA